MSLADVRTNLKTALQATGKVVYNYVPENASLPCYILVPASPYVSVISMSGKLNASFRVSLVVAYNDNQAAIVNLDSMIEETVGALPATAALGEFSTPTKTTLGPSEVFTTDVQVDLRA